MERGAFPGGRGKLKPRSALPVGERRGERFEIVELRGAAPGVVHLARRRGVRGPQHIERQDVGEDGSVGRAGIPETGHPFHGRKVDVAGNLAAALQAGARFAEHDAPADNILRLLHPFATRLPLRQQGV